MKLFAWLAIFVAAAATVSIAAILFFELATPERIRGKTFIILRGENALQIADSLKSEGYIKSKLVFLLRLLAAGELKSLKAGEYDLAGLEDREIIGKLAQAKTISRSITVVPGWTVQDIDNYLAREGLAKSGEFAAAGRQFGRTDEFEFLSSRPPGAGLEGFLFPDTYQIGSKAGAEEMIGMMLGNFGAKISLVGENKIKNSGKIFFDIIIMASMLEKEVRTVEDKKIVAGILWKRLSSGMLLQVDSTLLYLGGFDKDSESRYNTYKYSGLPPGPICNPGMESIEAAAAPADSPYWYYLSAPDGKTVFSKTYDEHLLNKAKYLGR